MSVLNKDTVRVVVWVYNSFIQWWIQGRGPGEPAPPLFFNQNEAQRAEKNFFGAPPPPLSEGLDPPVLLDNIQFTKVL